MIWVWILALVAAASVAGWALGRKTASRIWDR